MGSNKQGMLTIDDFREKVFGDQAKIVDEFHDRFGSEIDVFLKSIHRCYQSYEDISQRPEPDRRIALISVHIFGSIDNLMAAMRLLIHGFIASSAAMSLQYVESVMMALLLSSKDNERDYYEEYLEDLRKFRTSGLEQLVEENRVELGISEDGWSLIFRIRDRYNTYRHSTYTALSNVDHLRQPEKTDEVHLGPSFDEKKIIAYRAELESLLRATVLLADVMRQVKENLEDQDDPVVQIRDL